MKEISKINPKNKGSRDNLYGDIRSCNVSKSTFVFWFCLNPICIIAAMPHVLFITVVIGTWLEKDKILSNLDDVKEVNSPEAVESAEAVDAHNFIERLAEIRRFEEAKSLEETKRLQELTRLSSLDDKTMYFNSFSEAHTYASKTSGMIVRRNPDGVGFIAYRE